MTPVLSDRLPIVIILLLESHYVSLSPPLFLSCFVFYSLGRCVALRGTEGMDHEMSTLQQRSTEGVAPQRNKTKRRKPESAVSSLTLSLFLSSFFSREVQETYIW